MNSFIATNEIVSASVTVSTEPAASSGEDTLPTIILALAAVTIVWVPVGSVAPT
jgi:hypothetical protein